MLIETIKGILVVFCVTLFVAATAAAQTQEVGKHFSDYKGVAIGMKTDEVRSKLGNPRDKSDAMDLYVFSDSESAQFYYDAAKVVTGMMITYSGDLKKAPTVKDVLGEDADVKPDGGVFKMIRFPKAGYWISYNKTGGDDAIVNIAFQKI